MLENDPRSTRKYRYPPNSRSYSLSLFQYSLHASLNSVFKLLRYTVKYLFTLHLLSVKNPGKWSKIHNTPKAKRFVPTAHKHSFLKISSKSVQNFWDIMQIHTLTHATLWKYRGLTSLAKVIKWLLKVPATTHHTRRHTTLWNVIVGFWMLISTKQCSNTFKM